MSHPLYTAAPRSSVFPADAPCPDGYILVEGAPTAKPKSGFRPYRHLAPYDDVSTMARGIRAGRAAVTMCGLTVPPLWTWVARKEADGTPRKTTCPKCLTAIRRALA